MIEAYHTGKCPHCGTVVRFGGVDSRLYELTTSASSHSSTTALTLSVPSPSGPNDSDLRIVMARCPSCKDASVTLCFADDEWVIWPRTGQSTPLPEGVPDAVAADYAEACVVLSVSPKASASLSRRCLQALLVEAGRAPKNATLEKQIDHVLSELPSELGEALDAVRTIGNFAAHPTKSAATGEIVDVEPHEAEWNLEVVRLLADHYYERPKRHRERMDALNAKLAAAGRKLI